MEVALAPRLDIQDMLDSIGNKALEGLCPSPREIDFLVALRTERLPDLCAWAGRIKEHHLGKAMGFCAIINAKSGRCEQNCTFCAQSGHHRAKAQAFPFIGRKRILEAARRAQDKGVRRFAIVTSGMRPRHRDFDEIAAVVADLRSMGMLPGASIGILDKSELLRLREAGLACLHHNLETSASFFRHICTTHKYEEDVRAVREAVDLGLPVCSGGIFGLGESWADRVELALLLRRLGVWSVPINLLVPISGTPLENRPLLSPEEALRILAIFRFLLPDRHIRLCGGRAQVFGPRRAEILAAGASGIMVGDLLTVSGVDADTDRLNAETLGLTVE